MFLKALSTAIKANKRTPCMAKEPKEKVHEGHVQNRMQACRNPARCNRMQRTSPCSALHALLGDSAGAVLKDTILARYKVALANVEFLGKCCTLEIWVSGRVLNETGNTRASCCRNWTFTSRPM